VRLTRSRFGGLPGFDADGFRLRGAALAAAPFGARAAGAGFGARTARAGVFLRLLGRDPALRALAGAFTERVPFERLAARAGARFFAGRRVRARVAAFRLAIALSPFGTLTVWR